jgi:hypothetical protein
MAGTGPLGENVPDQTGGLSTAATPAPQADQGALPISYARPETRRTKRRREWQENKIKTTRGKKQHNQAATSGEQTGIHAPQHAGPESPCTAGHSHAGLATGRRRHPSHGRTESQWKVIEELRLCAGCLTKTTPPHKPGDAHAPCTGLPNAAFDHAKIAVIRKAVGRLEADICRSEGLEWSGSRSPQWYRQWRSGDASSEGSQRTLWQGNNMRHQHAHAGHSGYDSSMPGLLHEACATSGGSLHPFAPLYNLHDQNSYHQDQVGFATPTQRSAPHAADLAEPSASSAKIGMVISTGELTSHAAAPSSDSTELLGMAPATPLIPSHQGELIEEDLGTLEDHTPRIAVIPVCESSSGVPRLSIEDWDTVTKVPEGPPEEIVSSEDRVDKKILHLEDRSWTMQGLWTSLVSSPYSHIPINS